MDESMSPMSDASLSAGEILLRLTASATLAAGALLHGAGSAALTTLALGTAGRVLVAGASAPAWSDSGLSYASGVLAIAGSVPGTPSAGQVLIGGGAGKFGGALSCTTLTATAGALTLGPVANPYVRLGDGTNVAYLEMVSGNLTNNLPAGKYGVFTGGATPGAPGATQVFIGAGAIKAGAAISCASLTSAGDIASSGVVSVADQLRFGAYKTPASAGAAGVAGSMCIDASYLYVCISTNTWKRTALATW